jgi:hypothetical protein
MITDTKDRIGNEIYEYFREKGGNVKSIDGIQVLSTINEIIFDRKGITTDKLSVEDVW